MPCSLPLFCSLQLPLTYRYHAVLHTTWRACASCSHAQGSGMTAREAGPQTTPPTMLIKVKTLTGKGERHEQWQGALCDC